MDDVTLTLTRPAGAQAPTLRRIVGVLARAVRMDGQAVVRLRVVADDRTDLFISTPLGCIVSQRIAARPVGASGPGAERGRSGVLGGDTTDGAVVMADRVLAAVDRALVTATDPSATATATGTPPTADAAAVGTPDAPGAPAGGSDPTTGTAPTADVLTLGPRVDILWTGSPPPVSGFTVVETVPGAAVRELYAGMSAESREHSGPAGVARSLLDQEVLTLDSPATGLVAVGGRVIAAMGALGLATEPAAEALRVHDRVRVSVTGSWIRIDGLFGTAFAPRPGGLARIPQPR
ncbi:hypothetical protein [Corynebacterium bovis]|uniref:hypothetical protein n=1 Tax=Corynebacterium bovis TaxID=36808 RepID=UPI000F65308E|nr:hypothetical protein [Corynebacterium bovis]RRO95440.1 hypothetical protein CXF29_04805 [Corynebacterium bovis]RRQ16003.1 hypothetical protein CXF46_05005 [Corynebacterium bovis]